MKNPNNRKEPGVPAKAHRQAGTSKEKRSPIGRNGLWDARKSPRREQAESDVTVGEED